MFICEGIKGVDRLTVDFIALQRRRKDVFGNGMVLIVNCVAYLLLRLKFENNYKQYYELIFNET